MRGRRLLAALLCLVVAPAASAAAPAPQHGPFLLVALPALGTVSWRCGQAPALAFALEFRAFRQSATTEVRLLAGRRAILQRVVQPGELLRMPYLRARRQRLSIVQRTEPGTLRALLSVDFSPRHYAFCWPYLPPRIDLRVLPR